MDFNCLSLFSSAGVAETYFSNHGVNVKVAVELIPKRANLHKHFYPNSDMIVGNIRDEVIFNNVIKKAKEYKCDFILATPPCQGMSVAGKREQEDPRNDLIVCVVKTIKEINPRFVIIENVSEILKTKIKIGNSWKLIDDYLREELGSEYTFNEERKIVNSMNYGVAQSRKRCVYLLAKKSENIIWNFPKPLNYVVTMKDAIGNLPSLDPYITDITEEERLKIFPDYYKKRDAGLSISKWHFPPKHNYRSVIAMTHTPEGRSAFSNKIYYPKLLDGTRSKGFNTAYKRQFWNKPAYTITKYVGAINSQSNVHPGHALVNSDDEEKRIWSDARVLSIFELMRVSSLPDNWDVPNGTPIGLIREIIGEGVPPKLLEYALIELENLLDN